MSIEAAQKDPARITTQARGDIRSMDGSLASLHVELGHEDDMAAATVKHGVSYRSQCTQEIRITLVVHQLSKFRYCNKKSVKRRFWFS
ncbi:MAG: hypothetical protein ABIT64_03635 [Lysobacteraceae bacterium]